MSSYRKENASARDPWSERLSVILTPLICEGIQSIFNKALKQCEDLKEPNEYLKTFQQLLSSVINWSMAIVHEEVKRIEEKSSCNYLSEMVTGICISRVRSLSNGRAGKRQKNVTLSLPSLDLFIHKTYINVARSIYKRAFLFEQNLPAIQKQRNDRDLENLISKVIYDTVWDFIPEKELLRAILSDDTDHVEEITYEDVEPTTGGAQNNANSTFSVTKRKHDDVAEEEDDFENNSVKHTKSAVGTTTVTKEPEVYTPAPMPALYQPPAPTPTTTPSFPEQTATAPEMEAPTTPTPLTVTKADENLEEFVPMPEPQMADETDDELVLDLEEI